LPVIHPIFQQVDEFVSATERGNDGFNSTGTK
jgi:dUTPase